MAKSFGERIHVDTVGPVNESMGFRHLLVTRDEATDYPMVLPIKVLNSRTAAAAFETLYPASAKPPVIKCRPDNGSEFLGAFLTMLRRRHIELDKLPIPRRSETHSRAERFHRTLEEAVRTMLMQSGLPHSFWPEATVVFAEHFARADRSPPFESPFQQKYGKPSLLKLRPFGSAVTFLNDKSRGFYPAKFEPRGRTGLFIGYGTHRSCILLDLEHFVQTGRRKIIRTRDVKPPPKTPIFPLKDLMGKLAPHIDWHFELSERVDDEDQSLTDVDKGGDESDVEHGIKCATCRLWVTDSPATCPLCVMGSSSRRRRSAKTPAHLEHTNDSGCLLNRCSCADQLAEIVGGGDNDGGEHALDTPRPDGDATSMAPTDNDDDSAIVIGELLHEADALADQSADASAGASFMLGSKQYTKKVELAEQTVDYSTYVVTVRNAHTFQCLSSTAEHAHRNLISRTTVDARTKQIIATENFNSDSPVGLKNLLPLPRPRDTLTVLVYQRPYCGVYRAHRIKDATVKRTEEAQKAIRDELDNMVNLNVFNFDEVDEWDNVISADNSALHVMAHMLIGVKGEELAEEHRKWKARLVALGNQLRTGHGSLHREEDLYGCPTSLEAVRLVLAWGVMHPGYSVLSCDVKSAYLQAELKGSNPIWIQLPADLWSAEWWDERGRPKFRCPVMPLHKALYGLQRSGFDWGEKAVTVLEYNEWRRIKDVQELMFFQHCAGGTCILVVYVDDAIVAGPTSEVHRLMSLLRATSAKDCSNKFMMDAPEIVKHFLGFDVTELEDDGITRTIFISQVGYIDRIVSQMVEHMGSEKFLHKVTTPGDDRIISFLGTGEDYDTVGFLAAIAPQMVGALLYLTRCSRPDIAFVVGVLGRRVSCWTQDCDRCLLRLISFLEITKNWRLEYKYVYGNDLRELFIFSQVDADHGGNVSSGRSTSGHDTFLADDGGSSCLLNWVSKLQTSTSASTGEAEIVATNDVMRRSVLPLQETISAISGHAIRAIVQGDASVAEACIRSGWSKALRYIRKHQRVSICALHDMFLRDDCEYAHTGSSDNSADILTKSLDKLLYLRHSSFMGLTCSSYDD